MKVNLKQRFQLQNVHMTFISLNHIGKAGMGGGLAAEYYLNMDPVGICVIISGVVGSLSAPILEMSKLAEIVFGT